MTHFIKVAVPESHGLLFTEIPELVRFWSRIAVNAPGDCWPFLGPVDPAGYAQASHEGRREMVHRLAYSDSVGPIKKGVRLKQSCKNHKCCNPAHMIFTGRGRQPGGLSSTV